jgi:hypothetical protein
LFEELGVMLSSIEGGMVCIYVFSVR